MGKYKHKSSVFLEGGNLLGCFLYFKDKDGRGCFKFSIKPKLAASLILFKDSQTGKRSNMSSKKLPLVNIDVSYKFSDNLLELKREGIGEKPERSFIKLPMPHIAYLFSIRIKNWHDLPVRHIKEGDFLLKPPVSAHSLALIFSFAGDEGKPFMDEKFVMLEGRTIVLNLPHKAPFNKLWIGVVPDNDNQEPHDLTVIAPKYNPKFTT